MASVDPIFGINSFILESAFCALLSMCFLIALVSDYD